MHSSRQINFVAAELPLPLCSGLQNQEYNSATNLPDNVHDVNDSSLIDVRVRGSRQSIISYINL